MPLPDESDYLDDSKAIQLYLATTKDGAGAEIARLAAQMLPAATNDDEAVTRAIALIDRAEVALENRRLEILHRTRDIAIGEIIHHFRREGNEEQWSKIYILGLKVVTERMGVLTEMSTKSRNERNHKDLDFLIALNGPPPAFPCSQIDAAIWSVSADTNDTQVAVEVALEELDYGSTQIFSIHQLVIFANKFRAKWSEFDFVNCVIQAGSIVAREKAQALRLNRLRGVAGSKGAASRNNRQWLKFVEGFLAATPGPISILDIDSFPKQHRIPHEKGREMLRTLLTACNHKQARKTLGQTLRDAGVKVDDATATKCLEQFREEL